jgi:hypothetical protein
MNNDEWTDENEVYVQNLGEQASSMEWMNLQEEGKYRRNLSILNILVNSFAIGAALSVVAESFWPNVYVGVLVKITTIGSAALVKYRTSSKFSQLANIHKKISSDYHKIFDDVQYQLALSRENREHASKFISHIRTNYSHLGETSPTISNSIVEEFNRRYKLNGITKPIIAGELYKIPVSRSGDSDTRAILRAPEIETKHKEPVLNWRKKLSRNKVNQNDIRFSYQDYASTVSDNKPTINRIQTKDSISSLQTITVTPPTPEDIDQMNFTSGLDSGGASNGTNTGNDGAAV